MKYRLYILKGYMKSSKCVLTKHYDLKETHVHTEMSPEA